MTELKGITWDHTRGYLPMVATAQRFAETHPEVSIRWEKRSLKQFGDMGLEDLVSKYDLLVIDHPFIGAAAARQMLLPLEQHLPAEFLQDQATNAVGQSHASYNIDGKQYALATDAAAPISGWRPDLMEKAGCKVPSTWAELMEMAKRGLVALPGTRIDMLMHFYMMCIGLGEEPFSKEKLFCTHEIGVRAVEMLRELAQAVGQEFWARNPIMVWELLASGEKEAYCPFAYGYSNYSREGYAKHLLEVGGLISLDGMTTCRSVLGGAGVAVSSRSRHKKEAVEYCQYAASADVQKHLYFESGGQPGHRDAWRDEEVNRRSHGFFEKTLPTVDAAWLRPRWDKYHRFQEEAASLVHQFVWGGGDAGLLVSWLNDLAGRMRRREMPGGGA